MNKSIILYLLISIITQLATSTPVLKRVKHQAQELTFDDVVRLPSGDVDFSKNNEKLILYATIKFRSSVVLHANVTATLSTGNTAPLSVALLDDGTGSDLFNSNDGTYSGVIEYCLKPGRYVITYNLSVVDPSCNQATQTDCQVLTRYDASIGSVTILNCGTGGQLFGAGVPDLRQVGSFEKPDYNLTLNWTEGWNHTTIVAYDLFYLPQSIPGIDDQEWVDHGQHLLNVGPAEPILTQRTAEINLSQINGKIKIAIIARSKAGNIGKSNFWYGEIINDVTQSTATTTDINTTTVAAENLSSSEADYITIVSTSEAATPFGDSSKSDSETWIYVGIAIGCMFAVSGIVALIFVRIHRKNSNC